MTEARLYEFDHLLVLFQKILMLKTILEYKMMYIYQLRGTFRAIFRLLFQHLQIDEDNREQLQLS
jgi:hypothetical protein